MSWFNASQLSSFAKQALTSAQKSIDRVLDIKEEDQWGDSIEPTFTDPTDKLVSTGWGMNQWNLPSEERTKTLPPSSEAITKPVTWTVVDESEDFFSAFLPHGDTQTLSNTKVVSVPPAKSNRSLREKADKEKELDVCDAQGQTELIKCSSQETIETKSTGTELLEQNSFSADEQSQPELVVPAAAVAPEQSAEQESREDRTETDGLVLTSDVALTNVPLSSSEVESAGVFEPALIINTKNSVKTLLVPPKEILLESKDAKSEDRQSDTPSPPVSAFSSGTSTTSDIEVLDHESVLSESSASSRQETVEAKAGLHLMQGSFQLLSTSTCADFPHLDEYSKLTESCGSSSDAFERIDSFSVQSLDSRSVSEVNSDDEIPGNRTLASITAGHLPTPAQSAPQTKQEEEEVMTESVNDQSLDDNEMEESGRSATPVNCEQTDEMLEGDQEPETNLTLTSQKTDVNETVISQSTEEKRDSPCQIFELRKIIEELSSRIEKRESQLLVVSKDKARLEEECDNLKDEMISLKEESFTVLSLKDEFTQRIAEAERKAQLACEERDIAKKEIKGLREELASRLNSNETLELIKEKEEQIRELLEEGEKLSKLQLQHSNIIKKLRVKERESDSQITKQTKKLKEQEEELKHLQQVLDSKEEVEKQHRENIKKLNAVVERQEKELSKLQTSSEELQEKNRSLLAALDSSYKELAELHKANATKDSEAQELALSREVQAKEELSLALENAQEESRVHQEALASQVADLRLALQRAEQQHAKKEDYLREEISELQQRLQEAETRNQELSQSVTSATRPLLRQIENLQATLGAQTASWEKLEKNISDRLADAQAQLAVSVEKERSATEELLAIRAQIASLESQASLLRQEKGRLQGQLDAERMRREKLEDDFSRECVELENLKGEHARVLEEAKKEKLLLTNQLEMEKMKVEQEKKKCYLAQEALKEKERKTLSLSVTDAPASSTPTLSRSSSVSGVEHAGLPSSLFSQQEDSLDHSFSTMTMSISGTNLYEAARLSGGSSIIENLQSQLKLREGEIAQLQMEIASLERSRTVMAEELVRLTNQNDEMESKVQEIPRLKVQLKDLEQRHNTILQMYGEKAEEADELSLDLEDVKNMYKTQIDELLKNQKE
ncbi:TATA element modulatory factor-like isoform X1 [Sinocyclocheilus grahami]|uniref:TATA element modulatory factor-like n=2 Tax=Sinocyclocheilus grahami TaxID=75366 RepID=A0A672PEQ2_SINGR|nr:PREDICTED: TATA element modulatory factor-like isoform X1 [Sinocyclocheilus grahami]